MNTLKKKSDTNLFLTIGLVLGILNIITVHSAILSLFVAVLEYGIVLLMLFNRSDIEAFKYFLLFTCISIEFDAFITGHSSQTELDRWSFYKLPIIQGYLYILIICFIYIQFAIRFRGIKLNFPECRKLRRWLMVLSVSGIISIIIGMLCNDNGIMNRGFYPRMAISQMLNFFNVFMILFISLEIVKSSEYRKELAKSCEMILIIVAITTLISVFVFGMVGYYDDYIIMMTPLSIALTPTLVVFFYYRESSFPVCSLIIGIIVILATFVIPTPIGSKWYLILLAAFVGLLIMKAHIKSVKSMVILGAFALFIISFIADPLLDSLGDNYVGWKLKQALHVLNIFSDSGDDWLLSQDHSALYRIDEPLNIFIEYTQKPFYLLFGKGFGGTTLHHTNILMWETDSGAFSSEQVLIGAYSQMHETFACLFLRHGLFGLFFIVVTIKSILKRLYLSPWGIIAFVWFIFYWSYGLAILLGAVALVLLYSETIDNNSLKNIKKYDSKI